MTFVTVDGFEPRATSFAIACCSKRAAAYAVAAVYQLVYSTLPKWSLKTKELLVNFLQVFDNKGVTELFIERFPYFVIFDISY